MKFSRWNQGYNDIQASDSGVHTHFGTTVHTVIEDRNCWSVSM